MDYLFVVINASAAAAPRYYGGPALRYGHPAGAAAVVATGAIATIVAAEPVTLLTAITIDHNENVIPSQCWISDKLNLHSANDESLKCVLILGERWSELAPRDSLFTGGPDRSVIIIPAHYGRYGFFACHPEGWKRKEKASIARLHYVPE